MRGSSMSKGMRSNGGKRAILWNLMMFLIMMTGAVLVPFLRESGQGIDPVYLGAAAALALGAAVYAYVFESKASEGLLFWIIPLAYIISVAFLLLFDKPFTFPFWTFGGMLILCAFKLRYGMFLNIFLLFIIGSFQAKLVSEVLIIQILCLILFGIVMPRAKVWKDAVNILVSVAAVLICVRIICYFTMDKAALTNDIFCVAVVYAVVVCSVLLLARGLQETVLLQEQNESFEFLEELAAGAEEQDANVSEYIAMTEGDTEARTDYMPESSSAVGFGEVFVPYGAGTVADERLTLRLNELCDESVPLLEKFAGKFPKAFLHVRRVALIAGEVAERMDSVNTALVTCGGYYHEIGRLRGEKSLVHTLSVAKDEQFPEELIAVLSEHTVDGDKPTSKEAALLLLTDNICGMCEHLKKTQKGKILVEKVIDSALKLRLKKGDLNLSGLTAGDLSVIRNTMAEVIKEDMF